MDLTTHDCMTLLASESVGRLCIIDAGFPLAFPVNYRVTGGGDGGRIVVRTSPDASLAHYQGPSSFEVDWISPDRQRAWSVIARGQLRLALGDADLPDTHPMIRVGRDQFLVLDVSSMSGRRFSATPAADRFSVDWQSVDA